MVKVMGSFKAPGLDGLQPIFFKSQWSIVGPSIVKLVSDFFHIGHLDRSLNETLLVLIPKVDRPEKIVDFQPISLCNIPYKIITKLLTNHIKALMPSLVAKNQASFVAGRTSSDNIIIVQEVIHSMRRKTSRKGWMALKIDLKKAYDRVKLKFIEDTLLCASFSMSLTSRIMSYVCSADMKILWNGSVINGFSPSRGVRQGDPISPYLFMLCMERLGHLIKDKLCDNSWRPIYVGKNGPPLSHLFFADDLFFFTEANMDQAQVIQETLNDFCKCSGQKINASKTRIFFSNNVSNHLASHVSSFLNFS